ncbi:hypothetical protein GCM10010251_96100 [Streptomyces aurantiogriseus]|uniref:DNA polymerase Y-family little finger domain-containing protein n=1 Tax=Streptomyces aurantiogriseus TaxID=66870 RepID=A0A918L0S9_9ACTN|nr:hypothetical protein GCM10010251_96100 [Streptomyces aurantiogriseus]
MDAEAGEAEDDLSVRVLRESLFHRLGQIVGGGAGGFKLDQEGEHLLAQRVLDQRRLMGPVRAEDFAGRLTLTVRYADRNSTTRTRTLPEPTDHSPALAAAALELLTALGLQRARARAFTIRADNLLPARNAYRQLSLDPGDARARAAEAAADRAHRRFGPETVRPATLAG